MPAEYRQTYAYWIRNMATNSQLEAIQKDGDRIRKDNAALAERVRVLEDVAVVALDIDARLDAGRSVAVNSDLHIRLSRALAVETANRISSPTLLSGSAEA